MKVIHHINRDSFMSATTLNVHIIKLDMWQPQSKEHYRDFTTEISMIEFKYYPSGISCPGCNCIMSLYYPEKVFICWNKDCMLAAKAYDAEPTAIIKQLNEVEMPRGNISIPLYRRIKSNQQNMRIQKAFNTGDKNA